MMEQLKFGLAGILIGAFATFFVPRAAAWLVSRRTRRRFVRYVQPTRYAKLHSMSDGEVEGVGLMIHRVLMEQEDRCQQKTLDNLPRLGEKAPRCYEMTGRCFALLDAFSSCAWVCSEGDHVLERLVARALNNARAALRLTLLGFYDEAIVPTRSVGEIANLLSLFAERTDDFIRWKSLDERARRKEFAPVRVRTKLEDLGTPIRVKSEVYAELSTRGVHVNPRTSPQTYDMIEMPKGGGYYQEAGFFICQNELAQALTFVTYASAQLSHLEKPLKKRMLRAGIDLITNTGRIGIDNIQEESEICEPLSQVKIRKFLIHSAHHCAGLGGAQKIRDEGNLHPRVRWGAGDDARTRGCSRYACSALIKFENDFCNGRSLGSPSYSY